MISPRLVVITRASYKTAFSSSSNFIFNRLKNLRSIATESVPLPALDWRFNRQPNGVLSVPLHGAGN
jgi:hypothetical protein